PGFVAAYNNLGLVLREQGRADDAVEVLRQALQINESLPEVHNNLGAALAARGRPVEAVASYRTALRLRPSYAEAWNNLGVALAERGEWTEAIACYRQALQLRPDDAETWNNLGNALRESGHVQDALASYQTAIQLRPNHHESRVNIASMFRLAGRYQEALSHDDRALELRPDDAEMHYNRSLTRLVLGDFARGWPETEWRWRCPGFEVRSFDRPAWDGSLMPEGTILLHAEQGFGDTIQFIRYAPLVAQRVRTVIVECPERLIPLLSTCLGIDRLVPRGPAPPDFDVQASLLSLPGLFGTTLASIPSAVPYLKADPERVAVWRHELSALPGFKIGIAWQGDPRNRGDRHRSIPLACFAPLNLCPGVRLISLQKGPGADQIQKVAGSWDLLDLGKRLDESTGAFQDTAAVMMGLDLVISVDTSIAHLAGSLGVPVWLALSKVQDWRWLLDRDDSPWYPTLTLFRQDQVGDWTGPFQRMAAELARLTTTSPPILIEISPGELIDRITILELKCARCDEPETLACLRAELDALRTNHASLPRRSAELDRWTAALRRINETIWIAEDEVRALERAGDFGPRFIDVARSIARANDQRSVVKQAINKLMVSTCIEYKIHGNQSGLT
ncbi:MAG: DUF6165 family protein, partial [Isosphaeraceae bacterium]